MFSLLRYAHIDAMQTVVPPLRNHLKMDKRQAAKPEQRAGQLERGEEGRTIVNPKLAKAFWKYLT
jgi:hypothetical protein